MKTKIIGVPSDGIQGFTQNRRTDSVSGFQTFLIHGMLAAIRTIFISKESPICLYANHLGKVPLELMGQMIEPERV